MPRLARCFHREEDPNMMISVEHLILKVRFSASGTQPKSCHACSGPFRFYRARSQHDRSGAQRSPGQEVSREVQVS